MTIPKALAGFSQVTPNCILQITANHSANLLGKVHFYQSRLFSYFLVREYIDGLLKLLKPGTMAK